MPTGVHRQIAEAPRIPQHDGLYDTAVHVWFVDVWQGEADDIPTLPAGLPYRFSGPWYRRGRDRHDESHRWIHLHDHLGFGKRLVPVVGAWPGPRELQVRILIREALLYEGDPFVLISGAQRTGDDGEFARSAEETRPFVGESVPMPSAVAWFTKKSRASDSASASHVTT